MSDQREMLLQLAEKIGIDRAIDILNAKRSLKTDDCLTIVSNAGMHRIPSEFVEGELFVATDGMLLFTDTITVEQAIEDIAKRLSEKLREKEWKKVIIIPFGHAVISMAIKLIVYRITRINSHELFYFSDGHYELIAPFERSSLTESNSEAS